MNKLPKKNVEDILSLTPTQEGLLFHFLENPDDDAYFQQLCLDISGTADKALFQQTWDFIVQNNEILRTLFLWEKTTKPVQVVLKKRKISPVYIDISTEMPLAKAAAIDKNNTFDLQDVPFRVTLCTISRHRFRMIISNHHILFDGWSTGIILHEFFKVYELLEKGLTPQPQTKGTFKEFVKRLRERDKEKEKIFWQSYLKGIVAPTTLPIKRKYRHGNFSPGSTPHSTPHADSSQKGRYPVVSTYRTGLSKGLREEAEAFAKSHRLTLAGLLYTAWGIVLQRYANCDDILLGTTVSGRNAAIKGIEKMTGLFINTLPLRLQFHNHTTVTGLLAKTTGDLQSREPFETAALADINRYGAATGDGELFDSILVMENYPLGKGLKQTKGSLKPVSFSISESSHYALTITVTPFSGFSAPIPESSPEAGKETSAAVHRDTSPVTPPDTVEIAFHYKEALFISQSIKRAAAHFIRILQFMISNPSKAVHEAEILSKDERIELLTTFNSPGEEHPGSGVPAGTAIAMDNAASQTLHGLFSEQAARYPDRAALKATGTTVTYAALNEKSSQLAADLIKKGVVPGSTAAIMMERSTAQVIGILGILKTGAAYLPIETNVPVERINYMLDDSNAKILLKETNTPHSSPHSSPHPS
ncbi:MAG: AMP-binding protein, partial [bacterium]|nr:AMP-binding protein [bacterium]